MDKNPTSQRLPRKTCVFLKVDWRISFRRFRVVEDRSLGLKWNTKNERVWFVVTVRERDKFKQSQNKKVKAWCDVPPFLYNLRMQCKKSYAMPTSVE